MFKGGRIEQLLVERRKTKKSLFTYAGVSAAGLDYMIKGTSDVRVSNLEKIADFFKVPIDYFFDREVEIEEPKNIVEVEGDNVLRAKIKELEAEIKELNRENGRLEGKLELLTGIANAESKAG